MERPILFNTDMVKAILEGNKTQTRRIMKNIPKETHRIEYNSYREVFYACWGGYAHDIVGFIDGGTKIKPPYQVGDILWVRETWSANPIPTGWPYDYKASPEYWIYEDHIWMPSIHMPRAAARIFLKVTSVRAERLQDISEEDAQKEGIRAYTKDGELFKYCVNDDVWFRQKGNNWQNMPRTAEEAFQKLWNSCYKWPKCWEAKPWVWVIEFERVKDYVSQI